MKTIAPLFALFAVTLGAFAQSSVQVRSVGTLAELLQRSPVAGQQLLVTGYRAVGDWGSPRLFIATNAIPAATNSAHFFNPGGGTNYWMSADWNEKLQSVRWFGAVGDGVADDSQSILQAVAYAHSAAIPGVSFPAGSYNMGTEQIVITTRMRLEGCGAESAKIIRGGATTNALVRLVGASPWEISGLTFNGGGYSPLIESYLTAEGLLTRCNLHSYTEFGFKLGSVFNRVAFNRFRDAANTNAVGILISMPGSGNTIIGNSFGTASVGIRFDEPSNGLMIGPGNAFEDNTYGILIPRFEGGIYGGVQDLTIQGNFFEANSVSPLSIGWGPYTTNSYGHQAFKIAANAFAVSGNGPIYLDSVDSMTVEDHRFGPQVMYGTNFSMLHLRNNTYFSATNKTIHYGNLKGKVLDQDGVVFVNAGDAPSIYEFKPYFLSGSLGLAQPNPQTRLDVFGPIRTTYSGPLPTNGPGLELFYQDSPTSGVMNAVDRTSSTFLPMQVGARYLVGANWQFVRWPVNSAASMSNPPSSYGALWFTNVSGGTNIALVVRSPSGADTILGAGGSGTSTNTARITVAGTNTVDNPNFLGIAGTTPGYFGVAGSNGVIFQLYLHGVDTDRLNTNGAALYSLLMFDGTNWVATTNLGTLTADTLVIRSNFVGILNATNIDSAIARLASPALTGTPTVNGTNLMAAIAAAGGGSGDVVGPASAVSNNLPAFASTTGKLLKDSGVPVTNVMTVTAANAAFIPLTASAPTVMSGAGLSNQVFFGAPTLYAGPTNVLAEVGLKAPLASPTFTGTPAAPTPSQSSDGTDLATTHWVRNAVLGTAYSYTSTNIGSGIQTNFITIPTNSTLAYVYVINAGGGGGSGRVGLTNTVRCGGGGGGGSCASHAWIPTSVLYSSGTNVLSIVTCDRPPGGASQTNDSSNGNTGGYPNLYTGVYAGSSTVLLSARGTAGIGGTAAAGSGGLGGAGVGWTGTAGGAANGSGGAGANGTSTYGGGGAGGGAGGGLSTANTASNGGNGGSGAVGGGGPLGGILGGGGVGAGVNGTNCPATSHLETGFGGGGGGGGASNNAGQGGAGGDGGTYGAGGGGGGSATDGYDSGAGGAGGPCKITIIFL